MVSAKVIPPGGETEVKATLSTNNRRGKLRKVVTVTSNDPKTPRLVLTLQGDIITDVILDPANFWFGRLKIGETAEKAFSVVSRDPENIKITSIKIDHDRFIIKSSPQSKKTGQYTLRFKGSRETGSISATVKVTYRSDKEESMKFPVRVNVIGDLTYTTYIRFTKRDGKFPTRDVVFSSRSGKPVVLKSAHDPNGLLDLTIDKSNKQRPRVRAAVKDPSASYKTPKRMEFKVRTGDRHQPEVLVGYTISENKYNTIRPQMKPGTVKKPASSAKRKTEKNKS